MTTQERYMTLVGINYRDDEGDKRVEAGEIVQGLPDRAVKALLHMGAIEPAKSRKSAPAKGQSPTPEAAPLDESASEQSEKEA